MKTLRAWILRLGGLFHKPRRDRDLDEELESHLQLHMEDGLREGLTPAEARRRAMVQLGGLDATKEACRDQRGIPWVETLWWDARYAVRQLLKNPGFTVVAVLILALGIGANTAMFSMIDAVMLRVLPVKNPKELFLLSGDYSYPGYKRLRAENQVCSGLIASHALRLNASIDGEIGPTVAGQLVSGNYFTVLGVNAALGRVFNDGDDQTPGAHPVAVISHGYWNRRLGADPAVIGRTLRLAGVSFTIVGVTPPRFRGLEVGNAPEVWMPMMMMPQVMRADSSFLETPNWRILKVVGRLKPGMPTRQAAAALEVVFRQINQELADSYRGEKDHAAEALLRERFELAPCGTGFSSLRPQFARPLTVLMVVVALVLMIACVNVANLQLARAVVRQREIALRLALGAGRMRLIRQLLVESSLLAGLGGAFGLLFAWWSTKFILALLSSGRTPVTLDFQLDYRVLGFTATIAILTAMLFGLVPALRATRVVPALALKEDSRGATGGGVRWVKTLIVSQVTLSTLLLIGAGLFVQTLHKLTQVETGIRAESVFAARVEPKGSDQKSENASHLTRIYRELIERVEALPDVRCATLSNPSPFSHGDFGAMFPPGTLTVDGSPPPPGEDGTLIAQVYPQYFATLGTGVLLGRDFTSAECATNAPRVAIIGATMARRFFQAANPVGRLLRDLRGTIEIIGVVEDAKYGSLKEKNLSVMYFPFPHAPTNRGQMTLQIRVMSHSPALIAAIRREVQAVDAEMPLFEVLPLTAHVEATIVQERLMATVVAFFGAVALLLAAIGLYGVLAFSVGRRTREIGVRMALGAQRGDVLTLILWQGMRLALAGIALGLLAALGATRSIAGLLFGVSPLDPSAFLGVMALLTAVALLACWLPARRAAQVDPMVALRSE